MPLSAVQQIVVTGLAPTYATPLGSESIVPSDRLFLHVKNANASACTVTLVDPTTTAAGSAATNPVISVPASTGDRMIHVPYALLNPATGVIQVNFSVTTSVTAALLRM